MDNALRLYDREPEPTIRSFVFTRFNPFPMNELFKEITSLLTEQNNANTARIDEASSEEILQLINAEDAVVSAAVAKTIPVIAQAVDCLVEVFREGGHLLYIGAGTSGRLGVVDSSECPPTFGVNPSMVRAIIAGGKEAMFTAQEGAEDSEEAGRKSVDKDGLHSGDMLCAIAASGRTPFVRGALLEARERGATTILVTTNSPAQIHSLGIEADFVIAPQVGPEVIAGSTRMKSGTAQKLVLNMLSTAAMIRLGKTYGNIMVDLQLTNAKLKERAKNIVMSIAQVDYHTATDALENCGGHVKTALVMLLRNCSVEEAKLCLHKSDGFVRLASEYTL